LIGRRFDLLPDYFGHAIGLFLWKERAAIDLNGSGLQRLHLLFVAILGE